jgi:hypothetical protein
MTTLEVYMAMSDIPMTYPMTYPMPYEYIQ